MTGVQTCALPISDVEWAALDPEQMGLGPVYACTPLLKRQRLGLDDIDAWEINEAFAAQLLGCLRAWQDPTFCRDELGLDAPLGALDESKLNVDGGAIALGHPVGASGTRIVLHVLNVLKAQSASNHWVRMVEDVLELEADEQNQMFGEALPIGLRLLKTED